MFRRQGADTLPAHLEEALGIAVSRVRQLDVGVFPVDRLKGTSVVARLFPARRAHAAVLGDLAVLEQLQAAEFPAERPFGAGPLSVHDDQSVLVTHFVRGAPRPAWPAGYAASAELDAEELRRAPEVLMTRALIDIAFGVCREPAKVRQQVRRLPSVRKRAGALAAAALAAAPAMARQPKFPPAGAS